MWADSLILLQAEYLHYTYNSMPNITVALDAIIHDSRVQWDVYNSSRAEVTSNTLQDLLRASEYTGASVVYAIHYYVNGNNSLDNLRNYIVLDALQVSTEDDHWEIGANDFFELENICLKYLTI